jgi:hypothetical protein
MEEAAVMTTEALEVVARDQTSYDADMEATLQAERAR